MTSPGHHSETVGSEHLISPLVIITKCMDHWLLKKASSTDDRDESKQEKQNSEEMEVRQEKENLKKKKPHIYISLGLPGGTGNLPANAEDTGSIPGPERSRRPQSD